VQGCISKGDTDINGLEFFMFSNFSSDDNAIFDSLGGGGAEGDGETSHLLVRECTVSELGWDGREEGLETRASETIDGNDLSDESTCFH